MVNGVGGGNGDGSGASSSGLGVAAAPPAHEHKRRRLFFSDDDDEAYPTTAQPTPADRRCFVTVGATAGFGALLEEVGSPDFLRCLADHGFTSLAVQCGPDYDAFQEHIAGLSDQDRHGVDIRCFGYTADMNEYMLACRGEANVRRAGCVISHGGMFAFLLPSRKSRLARSS